MARPPAPARPQCLSVAPGRPGCSGGRRSRRGPWEADAWASARARPAATTRRRMRKHLRRCCRHRRDRERAGRDRGLPQGRPEVHAPGGSERRAAGRPARNRKNLAGKGGRRRGGGALLPCWRERPSTSGTSSRSRGSRLRQRPAPGSCPVRGAVGARIPPEDPARDEGLLQRYRDPLHFDSGGRGRVPCWHPPCSVEFWWAR
jgi:hypothetical protein